VSSTVGLTTRPPRSFWDPLGCLNFDFWGLGNEGTIGYLRHSEIKHGRIVRGAVPE